MVAITSFTKPIGRASPDGAKDDPYRSAPVVRYSSGRIPWARAIMLERDGHILVGQERRVQHEVRTLLLGAHATNKEESGR